jgi:hypothetical protein
MSRPSIAVLEAWIEANWPHGRPPWAYEVFKEAYIEEQRHRAVERTRDWRAREVAELRARVAKLERILGQNGKNLIDGISRAAGTVIRNVRAEDRERLLGEIESRGYVMYMRAFGMRGSNTPAAAWSAAPGRCGLRSPRSRRGSDQAKPRLGA